MDEFEARDPVRRCKDCLEYSHRTRDYTKNKDGAMSAMVPGQQTRDSSRGTRARQEGITMSKKLTAVMDKIGTHSV
ncbi:hypothetical protein E2562_008512 [Oryza meyeriana var. granulata]|uniref:Uncharacterized protein n=1 Tax=Oryza meyeriana var. granulata TaxID=110450 RepID=A0A6G1EGL2_9ORYZ|nr:hypothetical protein E2562_008512 [Oryza meyeriana var. granulata]